MRRRVRDLLVVLVVVTVVAGVGAALLLSHGSRNGASRGPGTPIPPIPAPSATPHLSSQLCATWAVLQLPSDDRTFNLAAATAIAANDVWAVGASNDGSGAAMHWNGSAWKRYPTPDVPGGTVFLGIAAASSTDVWAVGAYATGQQSSTTLIEHWNGSQWSVVRSPNPTHEQNLLLGVSVVARNDVWAVGTDGLTNTQPLMLHWDGTSWKDLSGPSAPYASELHSVAGISHNDVWAVGSSGGSGPQTLAEHWNGRSWQVVSVPQGPTGGGALNSVTARAANDVWAVGYGVSFPNGISLTEHWNGKDWQVVKSPSPDTKGVNPLMGVAAVPGTATLWAVGVQTSGVSAGGESDATSLIEEWTGSAWVVAPGPGGQSAAGVLDGVAATPDGDVWVVGHNGLTMVHAGTATRGELNCPAT